MRKLKIILTGVVAVLLALLVVALTVEFDAPRLGRRILDAAGASAGIELQASGFRFNLRRGIVLQEVVATVPIPAGTVVTKLDRVLLEHRLLPLLLGNIVVDRLVLESPVIEVINDDRGAVAAIAGARGVPTSPRLKRVSLPLQSARDEGGTRSITVHAASISDGTLLLSSVGEEPATRVYGLDAEVADIVVAAGAPSMAVGLSAHGHVDVGEVHVADRKGTGNRAQLTAAGGIFTVTGLILTTDEGHLDLEELVVDLNDDPYTYRTSVSGDDIDLNRLLGAEEGGLGAARFELDAAGAGPETASIVGSGRVYLRDGRLPPLPVLAEIEELIGLRLAGVEYAGTTIDFTVSDDRVDVLPFAIVSDMLRVESLGQLALDGAIDGRARVSVPRDQIEFGGAQADFLAGLVDALTDDTGWVSIPLLIGGTVDEPRVRPDSQALLAIMSGRGGLGSWLRSVIKRD